MNIYNQDMKPDPAAGGSPVSSRRPTDRRPSAPPSSTAPVTETPPSASASTPCWPPTSSPTPSWPPPAPAPRPTIKLDLADAKDEAVGTTIGRYKLLERLGEGGCGVVYVAEQTEPVRRRVALKVIKLGMDTKQVVARFEAERQALAMMDHPNIARVFDAGRHRDAAGPTS